MTSGKRTGDVLVQKIDIFMRCHVLPRFDPQDVSWLFSLSGGKDSFAMASGMRRWYDIHGFKLHALGFSISQWSTAPSTYLPRQMPWLPFTHIDGRDLTHARVACHPGRPPGGPLTGVGRMGPRSGPFGFR